MATDLAESPSGTGSKYRFLFSPKWLAFHLLVVVLIVTMVNLAFWQLRRLDERRDFNAQVRANANQPLMPIGDTTIVEILLRQLTRAGVTDVTMCIGHQAALIEAVVGEAAGT